MSALYFIAKNNGFYCNLQYFCNRRRKQKKSGWIRRFLLESEEKMKLEEVAELLQLSPNTIKDQFQRTKETLFRKQGLKLIKLGRGENAEYYIKVDEQILD